MLLSLTPRRDGWYVLLLAAFFAAKLLAPSLLLAAAPEEAGKRWVYVCGSFSNQWVQLDAGETPDGVVLHDECPLCGLFKLYDAAPTAQELPLDLHYIGKAYPNLWPDPFLSSYLAPFSSRDPPIQVS